MTGSETSTEHQAILVKKKKSGVAFVILDWPGKFNVLSSDFLGDFKAVSEKLTGDPSVKAAVFISGKPDSFIIGADLHEIIKMTDPAQPLAMSQSGQNVMMALANLPIPTVAAINGPCLGGGLEVALTCESPHCHSRAQHHTWAAGNQTGLCPGAWWNAEAAAIDWRQSRCRDGIDG